MMFLVYLIHNMINGKVYVGWTNGSFSDRWKCHCDSAKYGSKTHFHNAIRLYKPENFYYEIMNVVYVVEEAKEQEKRWIITLRAYDPEVGYNMTYGGDGISDPTGEIRRRILLKVRRADVRICYYCYHPFKPRCTYEQPFCSRDCFYAAQRMLTKEGVPGGNVGVRHSKKRVYSNPQEYSIKNSQRMERYWASLTPEKKKEKFENWNSTMTTEQRSKRARKSAETRKRLKLEQEQLRVAA